MLTSRGLGRVLGDLAELGYDAEWCVLGADDVGSPHRRKRIWLLACDATQKRRLDTANALHGKALEAVELWGEGEFFALLDSEKMEFEVKSEDQRMGDGLAFGMEQFAAIGNGQVPLCAATAFKMLMKRITRKQNER